MEPVDIAFVKATEAIALQTAEQSEWERQYRFSPAILGRSVWQKEPAETLERIEEKIAKLNAVIAEEKAKRAQAKSDRGNPLLKCHSSAPVF